MDLVELKEKTTMSREDAAARLHAIADELASGNGIVIERDRLRFVARVPDEVHLKIEFEVEDDGSEFEIELTWCAPGRHAPGRRAGATATGRRRATVATPSSCSRS